MLGVVLTDVLTRWRDRRAKLYRALFVMEAATATLLDGRVNHLSEPDLIDRYGRFIRELGAVRSASKWPMPNAREIRRETERILIDFEVAMRKWGAELAGPPRLGPIIGSELHSLVADDQGRIPVERLNAALKAAGLPTEEESALPMEHNMPPPGPQSAGR